MKTSDFKILAQAQLQSRYSTDEIGYLISLIMEERLLKSRLDLIREGDFQLSDAAESRLKKDIDMLAKDIPIQYIIGKVQFFGLDLKVSEAVLIPRNETEELVSLIATDYQGENSAVERIIDFGTGSACIALAMAKTFPSARVEAWDISQSALALAQENANLDHFKVDFRLKSILDAKLEEDIHYDLMISNPPYIPPSQKQEMEKRVLDYEPSLALFVEEENPLVFYRAIVSKAKLGLKKGGKLYFEINQYLAAETLALFEKGFKAELLRDLNGNWRFIRAEKA
jgi:release factor glutamine methyltransferase